MKTKIQKISKIIGVAIGVIIIGFMINAFLENWNEVKPYLINMKAGWFVCSIIVNIITFLFTANNWANLVIHMDKTIDVMEAMDVHIITVMAKYIPGGIWNVVGKAVLGMKRGMGQEAISCSMVLEYVFQISTSSFFLLFFLPIILWNTKYRVCIILLIILVGVVLKFLPAIINICNKFMAKILKKESNIILDNRYVYMIFCKYMLSWLLSGLGLMFLMCAFETINIKQGLGLVFAYPISWVAGFISPSPGGMGVREFILSWLLGSSFASSILLLISLTTRIWSIISEVLGFLFFKLMYCCIWEKTR